MKWINAIGAVIGLLVLASVHARADDLHIKEINLVHFSHTDVGFTDHPAVCRELYRRYLDVALDAALDTQKRPAGERFCWTAESTLAVKDWWDAASPQRRKQFLEAVRLGHLDVTALGCNNTPFLNAAQWHTMTHWLPEELWSQVQPKAAIQDDVNGFPRAAPGPSGPRHPSPVYGHQRGQRRRAVSTAVGLLVEDAGWPVCSSGSTAVMAKASASSSRQNRAAGRCRALPMLPSVHRGPAKSCAAMRPRCGRLTSTA